jgi:hypothetical protein
MLFQSNSNEAPPVATTEDWLQPAWPLYWNALGIVTRAEPVPLIGPALLTVSVSVTWSPAEIPAPSFAESNALN